MELNDRVDKIENRLDSLEDKFNLAIPEIQSGIKEIKTILQERPIQEELKNNLLSKEIENVDLKYKKENEALQERVKKIEESQTWLRRTVAASIIGIVIETLVFVLTSLK